MLRLTSCLAMMMLLTANVVNAEQWEGVKSMSDSMIIYETIAREARTEDQKIAVAHVIKNRMRQRGKTAREVCLEPYQFSCWLEGEKAKQVERTAREIQDAKTAWDIVNLPNNHADFPATHYFDDSIEEPFWAKSMKYLCTIGNQKFYQEVR